MGFIIRDSKTHERLGESDNPIDNASRFGRNRDDVYIDAYCEEDRRKLDAWVEGQRQR